ncbi:uroporphyrinogen-III C-methyltransferase [Tessaracoccus massiliensis]|uniref:uroporphyrinogen-III C-methyltransferase n=1 Tax=Tessaracoccus massiliensis TaxID=1522311 RepID=UPI00058DBC5A|nr:uroporphyrinogen-III C-methyltransferase [Tessaracoccus massiliensis]
MTARPTPGTVTLVGGGPGDPDLLTVGGLRALEEADVVVTDRLAPLDALAACRADCEIIHAGKIPRGAFTPQEQINELLVTHAQAGKRVVRFKGGDNFVFGRGGEEWEACAAAGIAVNVIPGVSSAIAVPGVAGIPVTHRGLVQGFTVVSGHVAPDDERSTVAWEQLGRSGLTLVILMGVHNLAAISAALLASGRPAEQPAAIIANGTVAGEQVWRTTLGQVAAVAESNDVQPPAITVIGDVAGFTPEG